MGDISKSNIRELAASRDLRIGIVGFGYIGVCIGAVLAEKGFSVTGIDISKRTVEMVNRGETPHNEPGLDEAIRTNVSEGRLRATIDFSALRDADVVIVTVGTPLGEGFTADTSQIRAAIVEVGRYVRSGSLIILKSTVPPLTTEEIVKPILDEALGEGAFRLAFCPERLAEGKALEEFEHLPIVVGGVDPESTEEAGAFWEGALGVRVIYTSRSRTAELVKLADNLWIDLNIALGNELAMLGARLGVDTFEVIEAANSLPKGMHNVNILSPSVGVGGYCLTKDPWFVHEMGHQYGLSLETPRVSRIINDAMPGFSFEVFKEAAARRERPLSQCDVAILGLAFKDNTGDCRYTPTKPFIELVRAGARSVRVYDPLVTHEDAHEVSGLEMSSSIEDAVRGADCVVFLTGHSQFKEYSLKKLAGLLRPGAVVFDGRRAFEPETAKQLTALGLYYQGIGR